MHSSSHGESGLLNQFFAARTAEERCNSWLACVCHTISGATAAAVLLENPQDKTFVPIAVWPAASSELGRLGAIVEAALKDQQACIKPAPHDAAFSHLAYPILLNQTVAAVVVVEVKRQPDVSLHAALQKLGWDSAWITNLLAGRELDHALQDSATLSSVMRLTTVSLRHGKLLQSLFELSHHLCQHFGCSRVAIGLANHLSVKVAALSDVATFEKNTPLLKAYRRAMEEALDAGRALQSGAEVDVVQAVQLKSLRTLSGSSNALAFPLNQGGDCVAVIILERDSDAFTATDRDWLSAFSSLVAPIILQRQQAEYSAFRRMGRSVSSVCRKLFGPQHLLWKTSAILSLLAILVLSLVKIEYRVSAKMTIEGEIQRVAAAPFEGFVSAAYVRAGDVVKKGQLLAQLDDRQLRIEEEKSAGETDQYKSKWQEAAAQHDLTAMQVVGAQLRQSAAQLALVQDKISRAKVTAPFDGVVVSGDLSQQIGAPVELGKKLFEIAPLQRYRVILQVDERDIQHIQVGQQGQIVITGLAGEAMPFVISKETPVATAQEGKNLFKVEAALNDSSIRLRPGMEGIGKVEVGSRSLWWILTHHFTDWLILQFWTWMP